MDIIEGKIIDVVKRRIFSGRIFIENKRIVKVEESKVSSNNYILPGLVDAHIHIESSMLVPSRFAHIAVSHGTVATVSDPHEIANVLGVGGIEFMINDGDKVPFKFFFGAPSCVPATDFESTGAEISPSDIQDLFKNPKIKYLSEMMNFPGVIHRDPMVMEKMTTARNFDKPIDGHAPGLQGDELSSYIDAGISTDHECSSLEEAEEKLQKGMKILIREGSAAKNFESLHSLISKNNNHVMLCSDDLHPDDLINGHINLLIQKALNKGHDLLDVLRCVTLNPVKHYNLEVGLLQEADPADFIVVEDLQDFNVLQTWIEGEVVFENKSLFNLPSIEPPNVFRSSVPPIKSLVVENLNKSVKVISVNEGQLYTSSFQYKFSTSNASIASDVANDILKIVVLNRFKEEAEPAIGFIHGFGLKRGALGSTIAHDSHNIIVVGTNDDDIQECIAQLIFSRGGIVAVDRADFNLLPLEVAGIMSSDDSYSVSKSYKDLSLKAKEYGCVLHAPFMTLSFMALLVIPELKMSDRGLFDGKQFQFVDLFVND